MARSLTRREDWPRDAVDVRRPGGQPPPLLAMLQRPGPEPAQSNRQADAVSRFAEDSAVSTRSLGREAIHCSNHCWGL